MLWISNIFRKLAVWHAAMRELVELLLLHGHHCTAHFWDMTVVFGLGPGTPQEAWIRYLLAVRGSYCHGFEHTPSQPHHHLKLSVAFWVKYWSNIPSAFVTIKHQTAGAAWAFKYLKCYKNCNCFWKPPYSTELITEHQNLTNSDDTFGKNHLGKTLDF